MCATSAAIMLSGKDFISSAQTVHTIRWSGDGQITQKLLRMDTTEAKPAPEPADTCCEPRDSGPHPETASRACDLSIGLKKILLPARDAVRHGSHVVIGLIWICRTC